MWRKVVIDLTSLLDVILILLFLVLTNASTAVNRVKEEAVEQSTHMEQLESDNSAMRRSLDAYQLLDAQSNMIRVFIDTASSNAARTVYVETNDATKSFLLTWSNAAVVQAAMTNEITNICDISDDAKQISFIVFRYDRTNIYQSDYLLISNIISSVKAKSTNIYSAEYDIMEEVSYEP